MMSTIHFEHVVHLYVQDTYVYVCVHVCTCAHAQFRSYCWVSLSSALHLTLLRQDHIDLAMLAGL